MNTDDTLSAQVGVLGSLLLEPKLIGAVLDKVQPADFLSDTYRAVFYAIRSLFSAGAAVDPVTIRDKLGRTEGVDWSKLLLQLMELTPTAANIWAYVKLMQEQARLAAMQALGEQLQRCGDLDGCRDCIGRLNGLLTERQGVHYVTMEQALLNFYERHREKHDYLSWGLEKLDGRLYIEAGDFVVLGGYSSAGKTALALRFAWHLASGGKKVGFFSLETGAGKIFDRLVSSVARMEFSKIKRGTLTEDDYSAITTMSKRLTTPQLEIIKAARMSVDDMQAFSLSRGYDVVFIDYLQIIETKIQHTTEAVSKISIGLHQFSQGCNVTVVALSQLSRPEKTGTSEKAPNMHSLRESGQIEQDADAVLLLYKETPDDPNSRRILNIAKNKEGELGQFFLLFDGATQTFRESAVQVPAPPKRAEPDCRQVQFRELTDINPGDLPF